MGHEGLALGEMFRARPRLGIQYVELTDQLARYFKVSDGVLVSSVSAGSPAEKAGLRAGDVIVKVGGDPVSSGRDLLRVVRAASDGEITLGIQREGHALDLRVRLEPRTPRRPKEPLT
jgi:serine protease Do